jgi:hypothetical protein
MTFVTIIGCWLGVDENTVDVWASQLEAVFECSDDGVDFMHRQLIR